MIFIVFFLFLQNLDYNNTSCQDECSYLLAYNYINESEHAIAELSKAFQFVKDIEKRDDFSYCIDSLFVPLSLSSFQGIDSLEIDMKIINLEGGTIPKFLSKFSECENANLNMRFSRTSESFFTMEISSRMFNPLGGCSKGPSVEFLFYYNNHKIRKIASQHYNNG